MTDELIFDPVKHEYFLGGDKLPGVTSILQVLGGYEGIPKHILDAAAERGTAVHRVCELHDLGTLDYGSLDDELIWYLMAWQKFLDDKKPEIIEIERPRHHPLAKYAGTYDRVLVLDGTLSMLDLKSSYKLMPATGPQTAAYAEARNAHIKNKTDHTKKRYGLKLMGDGTYELQQYKDPSDLNTFMACLTVTRWKQRNK